MASTVWNMLMPLALGSSTQPSDRVWRLVSQPTLDYTDTALLPSPQRCRNMMTSTITKSHITQH